LPRPRAARCRSSPRSARSGADRWLARWFWGGLVALPGVRPVGRRMGFRHPPPRRQARSSAGSRRRSSRIVLSRSFSDRAARTGGVLAAGRLDALHRDAGSPRSQAATSRRARRGRAARHALSRPRQPCASGARAVAPPRRGLRCRKPLRADRGAADWPRSTPPPRARSRPPRGRWRRSPRSCRWRFADVVAALTANLRMIRRIAEIYGGALGHAGRLAADPRGADPSGRHRRRGGGRRPDRLGRGRLGPLPRSPAASARAWSTAR
jgi:hypothetical protein